MMHFLPVYDSLSTIWWYKLSEAAYIHNSLGRYEVLSDPKVIVNECRKEYPIYKEDERGILQTT